MTENEEFEFRARAEAEAAQAKPAPSTTRKAIEGAALGVSDLGNTALNALAYLPGKISPKIAQWNRTRNADFEALTEENKDSTAFNLGRIGGNVVSTLPVGGVVGGGVKSLAALPRLAAAAPKLEQLGSAIASGGMRTGAGLTRAAPLAARAGDMAVRTAGGAIAGGAGGALINPENAGTSALIGGALPPALVGLGKAARYAGRTSKAVVQPFTAAGQSDIAAKVISKFGAGGPMDINAAELVPGSLPTLAEATGNAGIAGLQRVARDVNPNAFALREAGNASARTAALDDIAGDAGRMEAAKLARTDATEPLYDAAFKADRIRQAANKADQAKRAPFTGIGVSGAADDLATPGLRELARRPMFAQAVEDARRLAANNNVTLDDPLQSLQGLHYIKLALDDALNPAAKSAMGRNASNAVMGMRDKLADELAKVSPGYGTARSTFAELSKPINAMEHLQGLRVTDAKGEMTLSKTKSALEAIDRLRAGPGIHAAKAITAGQRTKLDAIHADLLRQTNTALGKSAGSNTFQNIATDNILGELMPGKLGGLVGGKIGSAVGQVGKLAYSGPNAAIRNQLADMMLDPDLARAALARQRPTSDLSALEQFLGRSKSIQALPRLAPVATQDRK
jgi:hypothetical protein